MKLIVDRTPAGAAKLDFVGTLLRLDAHVT
jgi:hypothetical protein